MFAYTRVLAVMSFVVVAGGGLLDAASGQKPKILILSSTGGYGHVAATRGLQMLLGDTYEISVAYPFKTWLSSLDSTRFASFGSIDNGEDLYNYLLSRGWTRTLNLLCRTIAPQIFRMKRKIIGNILYEHFVQEKPDLIISVIPLLNLSAMQAAEKLDIPYLLITLDYDLHHWAVGLHKVTHPNFAITIGHDVPTTRDLLLERGIEDQRIITTGLPLRADFFTPKKKAEIRRDFDVPDNKKVILLMMGGAGVNGAKVYARQLLAMDLNAHLIICAGRNKKLARTITQLPRHASMSLSVVGFTQRIPDLMAICDLFISKPGGLSVSEGLAMHCPMILDQTSIPLSWERAQIQLVKTLGVGESLTRFRFLEAKVRRFLYNERYRRHIDAAYAHMSENQFNQTIPVLITQLMQTKNNPPTPVSFEKNDTHTCAPLAASACMRVNQYSAAEVPLVDELPTRLLYNL